MTDPATGTSSKGPWTIYGVDAAITPPNGTRQTHDDMARLTPLPTAAWPKVMFMGAVDTGHQAVFALGAGVDARGPGRCSPSRGSCELIELTEGQTEHLDYLLKDGTEHSMTLKLSGISSRVTSSVTQAVAAFNRRSEIGLCELQLGDPIDFKYDVTSGSLQSTASTQACHRGVKSVPFPGTGNGL